MKRVLVLVEGQTEETFVRDVLAPHLASRSIAATPVILKTKRVKSGGAFRGGISTTEQVLGDTRRLLGDGGAHAITSVLDYYALPEDFPGLSSRQAAWTPLHKVTHVEQNWGALMNDRRFIPHLALHEFEAWIYADPDACSWLFPAGVADQLRGIATTCGGPELIDDGPTTAPSKRLLQVVENYRKVLMGPMAVEAIGLAKVRSACPHFDGWLSKLEAI